MTRKRNTARRSYADLQAETRAREREAAVILRQKYERRLMLPGYLSRDARDLFESVIAELEGA